MIDPINTFSVKTFEDTIDERQTLVQALIDHGIDEVDAYSVVFDAYDLGFNRMNQIWKDSLERQSRRSG